MTHDGKNVVAGQAWSVMTSDRRKSDNHQFVLNGTCCIGRMENAVPPTSKTRRLTSRQFHRWLGIGAAVLFLLVSGTGVALQYQQIFGSEEAVKEAAASIVSPLSFG